MAKQLKTGQYCHYQDQGGWWRGIVRSFLKKGFHAGGTIEVDIVEGGATTRTLQSALEALKIFSLVTDQRALIRSSWGCGFRAAPLQL